jgi:hypothetical protein
MREEVAAVDLGVAAVGLGLAASAEDAAWLLAAAFAGVPSEGAVSPRSEDQALVWGGRASASGGRALASGDPALAGAAEAGLVEAGAADGGLAWVGVAWAGIAGGVGVEDGAGRLRPASPPAAPGATSAGHGTAFAG